MAVGILEVEGADAGRIFVPVGQALRGGGGVLHLLSAEKRVCPVHVADYDGNVLKPTVIRARVNRNRSPLRDHKFCEFNRLVSELEPRYTYACAENPVKLFDGFSC